MKRILFGVLLLSLFSLLSCANYDGYWNYDKESRVAAKEVHTPFLGFTEYSVTLVQDSAIGPVSRKFDLGCFKSDWDKCVMGDYITPKAFFNISGVGRVQRLGK